MLCLVIPASLLRTLFHALSQSSDSLPMPEVLNVTVEKLERQSMEMGFAHQVLGPLPLQDF